MKYLFLIGCLVLPAHFTSANETTPVPATSPSSASDGKGFTGKVVETMSTAGYTYVLVDTGDKKLWAAAMQFAAKVGDTVTVAAGTPMPNYHSKSLDRDFDVVHFTGSITVNGPASEAVAGVPALPAGHPPLTGENVTAPALPAGHPSLKGETAKPKLDLTGIKRADGGQTIQEIFAAKSTLAGNPVTVRGKVVKYNPEIMGKNWLHIQDGSGSRENNDNDLTITTTNSARVGDTVVVTGNVSTNKDFGAGYKYSLMIDEANVLVE